MYENCALYNLMFIVHSKDFNLESIIKTVFKNILKGLTKNGLSLVTSQSSLSFSYFTHLFLNIY